MKPRPTKPNVTLQPTTLWDYPSQHYGNEMQGDQNYKGATPSYIIWNLIQRYTKKRDLVIDPMAGSGTTLDVARDLGRKVLGYDLGPTRKDIFRADRDQRRNSSGQNSRCCRVDYQKWQGCLLQKLRFRRYRFESADAK